MPFINSISFYIHLFTTEGPMETVMCYKISDEVGYYFRKEKSLHQFMKCLVYFASYVVMRKIGPCGPELIWHFENSTKN